MLKHYKTNTKIALAKTTKPWFSRPSLSTRDWSRGETKVKLHRGFVSCGALSSRHGKVAKNANYVPLFLRSYF